MKTLKILFLLLLKTSLYAAQSFSATITLYAIKNVTPFDLLIIDRTNPQASFRIKPKELCILNYPITGIRQITGPNLAAAMAQDAQFIVKQLNSTTGQPLAGKEVYMGFWLGVGGTHDGSGFVSGKLGYPVLKFFLAAKEGSAVQRQTVSLKNPKTTALNLLIEFTKNGLDVELGFFKFSAECVVKEK